jgi:hypothetical protein
MDASDQETQRDLAPALLEKLEREHIELAASCAGQAAGSR